MPSRPSSPTDFSHQPWEEDWYQEDFKRFYGELQGSVLSSDGVVRYDVLGSLERLKEEMGPGDAEVDARCEELQREILRLGERVERARTGFFKSEGGRWVHPLTGEEYGFDDVDEYNAAFAQAVEEIEIKRRKRVKIDARWDALKRVLREVEEAKFTGRFPLSREDQLNELLPPDIRKRMERGQLEVQNEDEPPNISNLALQYARALVKALDQFPHLASWNQLSDPDRGRDGKSPLEVADGELINIEGRSLARTLRDGIKEYKGWDVWPLKHRGVQATAVCAGAFLREVEEREIGKS